MAYPIATSAEEVWKRLEARRQEHKEKPSFGKKLELSITDIKFLLEGRKQMRLEIENMKNDSGDTTKEMADIKRILQMMVRFSL